MIANDPEALADFREAVKEQGNNQHTAKSIPNNVREAKVTCGNGKAYTLSRLKRETPDLFAAVVEPGFIMATVVAKNLHGKQHTASQRAMIANSLLPFYQSEAKERQKEHGGTAPGKSLVVKIPQVKEERLVSPEQRFPGNKARDEAGKAAGVSGTYVDKARDVKGTGTARG
jgi:hypothetical protein